MSNYDVDPEFDYVNEPTTAETVLAAFPELRDTGYGAYLDMLDREAERGLAQFHADMAHAKCAVTWCVLSPGHDGLCSQANFEGIEKEAGE